MLQYCKNFYKAVRKISEKLQGVGVKILNDGM